MKKLVAVILMLFVLAGCSWLEKGGGTYTVNAGQTVKVVGDLIKEYEDVSLIVKGADFTDQEKATLAVVDIQFKVMIAKLKEVKKGELITAEEFFEMYDLAASLYVRIKGLITPRFDSLPEDQKIALIQFDEQAEDLKQRVEWLRANDEVDEASMQKTLNILLGTFKVLLPFVM